MQGSSGGGAQQFLVWHGEKIVVGIIAVVALWFAMQGLGYQTLSWQPNELEDVAGRAEQGIRASTRSAEDEEIAFFDYEAYAEQIREPLSATHYRTNSVWNPVLNPSQRSTGTVSSQE